MLRIYSVILEVIVALRSALAQIERRDSDLAKQLRRASASIALNTSEGMYSRGKNRQARYHTALGSARESLACLEVAAALGYIASPGEELRRKFDAVIGTLVRLVEGPRS
jgi:four helix bundle protein